MSRLDDIKRLLLDMISSARPADPAVMASLSATEWESLQKMAGQHRLEPMLHHQLETVGSAWVVPSDVRSSWAAAYRKSALRSLSLQRTLFGVDKLLKEAGIPYAALKGAWLAWHAYPHPALRPMRDIDVLVPPEHTLKAFDVLLAGGMDRIAQYMTPPAVAFEQHKHLPPIADSRTSISVEVHSRLIQHGSAQTAANTVKQLSSRIFVVAGNAEISYLSKADSLLHLIEHSAYDHRFNNGPAVLNDIVMLLKSGSLDWNGFWETAEAQGRLSGCSLIFAMAEHYHGDVGIVWPTGLCNRPPDMVLEAAALMTLQDFDYKGSINLGTELGAVVSVQEWLAFVAKRLGTSRYILASFSGISPQSKLIWSIYPAWLATRLFQYVRALRKHSVRAETERAGQVIKWLEECNLASGEHA